MKKITLLLLAIFGLAFHVSAEKSYDNLQGRYYSSQGNCSIKVKTYNRGIRVKGLPGYRNSGYQKFRSVDYDRFRDRSGNIIEIGRRGSIVFINRNHRIIETYRSDRYSDRGRSAYRYRDRYNSDRSGDRYDLITQMEGRYRVQGSKDIMELVKTGEGFKTRVVGISKWTHYTRDYNDVWVDRKGNKIFYKGEGLLKWESERGRLAITLNKIYRRYN